MDLKEVLKYGVLSSLKTKSPFGKPKTIELQIRSHKLISMADDECFQLCLPHYINIY